MLLRKIDGEMNVQNGGYSARLRNGDGGDILHNWWLRFTSVYICAIATVVPQLTATAVAMHPRSRISKRWHVADIKNITEDDQATLTVDRNSAIYFVYVYEIATNAPVTAVANGGFRRSLKRHIADVKNIARKTRIDLNSANTKMYVYEIKQNVSKNVFLLLRTTPLLMALHTVFFLLSLATAFVLTYEK